MNNIDKQYTDLLQDILDNGVTKSDRTGTGTISVFGRQIRHKMSEGFPLLTTKKMAWKTMVTELLWFLRGDTNIKFLVDNNCHIWDGDAYKAYLKRMEGGREDMIFDKETFVNEIKNNDKEHFWVKQFGELGPIYGKQWRRWTKKKMYLSTDGSYEKIFDEMDQTVIDQIAILINDLKTNPDSRRLMVNAWNVSELDQMVLPPCHYGFQVYTRELSFDERLKLANIEKPNSDNMMVFLDYVSVMDNRNIPTRAISLMWNQRSVDTPLGLPFNIASYGLLLEIIAKTVNMVPDELIGNLGDCHIYLNQIDGVKEQIGRELIESERYRIFEDRGYEFRMVKDWSKEEQYDKSGIPKRTREPYPLPTLKINSGNENWHLLEIDEIINTFDTDITFKLENYQSHPTIKMPLSN